jgi:excisionase family DNA binding protein
MESMVEVSAKTRTWFEIKGAAEYLGVKVRTIREAIWAGELERARLGKRFIFSRASLDAWASSKMVREGVPQWDKRGASAA